MSLDELVSVALSLQDEALETVTGKQFKVGVYMGCPFFIPDSSGRGRSDGKKAAEAFLELFNQTRSTRISDYQAVTRNASYFIPLVLAAEDHQLR